MIFLFCLFSIFLANSFNWKDQLDGFEDLDACKQNKNECITAIRKKQKKVMEKAFNLYLDIYNVRSQFIERFGILLLRPPTKAMSLPVVVWLHDGAFLGGDYRDPMAVQFATQSGCLVIVIRLRHSPEVPLAAIIHDGLLAVSWANSKSHIYGGDPERLSVVGHGTGVYIAAHVNQMLTRLKISPLVQISIPFSFIPFEITAKDRDFIISTYDLDFWQNLDDTSLPPFPAEEFRHQTRIFMLLAHADENSHPLANMYLELFSSEQTTLISCQTQTKNPSPCLYRFIKETKFLLSSKRPTSMAEKAEL